MRIKHVIISGLLFAGLIASADWALGLDQQAFNAYSPNPFVQADIIASQEYMQTKLARGLISFRPLTPGHCLIIPKRFVLRFEDLTDEELIEIGYIIRRTNQAVEKILGPCGYILLQKSGPNVGQSVAHLHWHYIPRPTRFKSVLMFALKFVHPFHFKLSAAQLKAQINQLKEALEQTQPAIKESKVSHNGQENGYEEHLLNDPVDSVEDPLLNIVEEAFAED